MTNLYPILFLFPFLLFIQQHWCLQPLATAADGFIGINGAHFTLNGAPFYANGFNAYWLMDVASKPCQRSKVTSAFREAISSSLVIARTWAFSDGGSNALQSSPGVYNENMFKIVRYLELALEKRVVVGKDRGLYVETFMTFKTINYCWFIYYASATL
ncbi:putative mannan endo-1,4-beta-mannosidase [Helianthus annuus]|nr:putative mannan endo-1,4-beta-mannosidase [Helianthus annuus]